MATADKLNKLLNTKAAIKQAIINKGVDVSDDTIFADYPAKISAIEAGGGSIETNPYEELFNTRTNGGIYAYLFAYCNAKSLDLSSFDTSKATNMAHMFYNCYYLTSIDLSNFDTNNVTNMTHMFYVCKNLTELGLNNFNTSKVTDMSYMFCNCSKLTELDLSSFDTSNVTDMAHMFDWCANLTSLDVSSFDTSKVTDISYMFNNCNKLTSLDLSSWDVSKVTTSYAVSSTFYNCTALTDFKAPKNINATFNFSSCTKLTHDSLMSIINNLATVTSTKKLTLGATNLAKLTDDELAIAVNRGWTLV